MRVQREQLIGELLVVTNTESESESPNIRRQHILTENRVQAPFMFLCFLEKKPHTARY